jgi:hypothetical protein
MYKQSYRRLLKSAEYAFRGDLRTLQAAKIQLREKFVENKSVTDPEVLKNCYFDVDDIDNMLRFHLVQGKRNERGNYGMLLSYVRLFNTTKLNVLHILQLLSSHLRIKWHWRRVRTIPACPMGQS